MDIKFPPAGLSLVPADDLPPLVVPDAAADSPPLTATAAAAPAETDGSYTVEGTAAGEPGVERVDRFMAEAYREYDKGQVDQPLWTRALALANGDATLAKTAYLRARATALKVMRRDKKIEVSERRATAAAMPGSAARSAAKLRDEDLADEASHVESREPPSNLRRYAVMGGATLGALIVAAWLFFAHGADDAAKPMVATAAAASMTQAAKLAAADAAAKQKALAEEEDASQNLKAKVQELKDAGNWNVMVLYAAEWTRKEPTNGVAWKELSNGYVNLKQFADAQAAAAKATEVAPKDALLWRNLGRVSMDMDQPAAALHAYEQATALDDKDAEAFIQTGILNARLGHLPEAKLAFASALTITPENADAQCGDTLVTQRLGRSKDAAKSAKSVDKNCVDLVDGKPEVVAAPAAPVPYKTVRLSTR
jgi:tetratricopeptide (TPR) repeat protein